MAEGVASPIVKQSLWGGLLLVLALILWELRDAVPSWLAKSVTATAEFSTTGERDDARAFRAFDAVRGSFSADAILEVLPNQTRVRHTRLTVMAPSSVSSFRKETTSCVRMPPIATSACDIGSSGRCAEVSAISTI